jgi:hypothetical protein
MLHGVNSRNELLSLDFLQVMQLVTVDGQSLACMMTD